MPNLKLPSIHTTHWDPLFAACEETGTVVNVHIGSSSTFPVTSPGRPASRVAGADVPGFGARVCRIGLPAGRSTASPRLLVALSEGQVGWIPYILERLDQVWNERPVYGNLDGRLTKPPECVFPGADLRLCV